MCRSVPQIEVALTLTSTSAGPIVGTGTVSIASPFAACVFRSAFMVASMPAGCLQGQGERHIRKNSMLAHRLVLLQCGARQLSKPLGDYSMPSGTPGLNRLRVSRIQSTMKDFGGLRRIISD